MIQLRYFADPMCSWCWGFAPVIQRIQATNAYQVELVMGGLRAGETRAITVELRDYVLHHWQQVAQTTGQPFDFENALPDGFVYDTEPACRAVVVVRESQPELGLAYLHALQQAFYAEGKDVTQPDTLADLAAQQGLARDAFLAAFDDPQTRLSTQADFECKAKYGVMGFPCLLVNTGQRWRMVSMGYQDYDTVVQQIQRRIERDAKSASKALH